MVNIQVTFVDRSGKSGRGICLQDIEATPDICMSRIRDLPHYKDMVSSGKNSLTYISHTECGIQTLTYYAIVTNT